mgnify:FL=1
MTNHPIDLDARRTAEGRQDSEFRRQAANAGAAKEEDGWSEETTIDTAMLAGPAQTWIEAIEKTRFLLRRYAATHDALDPRPQKLIKRTLGDLHRLKEREETRP